MKHLLLFCLLACQSYAVFIPVGGAVHYTAEPQDAQELPFTQRSELQRCGQLLGILMVDPLIAPHEAGLRGGTHYTTVNGVIEVWHAELPCP